MTSYQHANLLQATGFSEQELSHDTYRVQVRGTAATPPERLEKIALARAAEIGVENRLRFFKVGVFTRTTVCKDPPDPHVKGSHPTVDQGLNVTTDVVYAAGPVDPSFLPSGRTFERLSQELNDDRPTNEAKAAAQVAIDEACGK